MAKLGRRAQLLIGFTLRAYILYPSTWAALLPLTVCSAALQTDCTQSALQTGCTQSAAKCAPLHCERSAAARVQPLGWNCAREFRATESSARRLQSRAGGAGPAAERASAAQLRARARAAGQLSGLPEGALAQLAPGRLIDYRLATLSLCFRLARLKPQPGGPQLVAPRHLWLTSSVGWRAGVQCMRAG